MKHQMGYGMEVLLEDHYVINVMDKENDEMDAIMEEQRKSECVSLFSSVWRLYDDEGSILGSISSFLSLYL